MERATYGSLHDFLLQESNSLDALGKIDLCVDVTAGLAALHQAGIIHGDVKADNVLIFDSPVHSGHKKYVAKLSDFGSIILLDDARMPGRYVRYYGTSLTNAPETLAQSGKNAIPPDMLIRCDIYSLGLLFLQIVAGCLHTDWTSKNEEVMKNALKFLQQYPDLSTDSIDAICKAIKQLLPYRPGDRCADLAVVLNLLQPFELSDIGDIW